MFRKLRPLFARATLIALALTTAPVFADVTVPQTAAEHEALAQSYESQATEYRKQADAHKEMAKEYAASHQVTGRGASPSNRKMQKHCMTLAKDYEKLATDADTAATYHKMRAKELQGQ